MISSSLYQRAMDNFASQPSSRTTLTLPSNITPPGGGGVPVTSSPPSIVTDAFRRASQYVGIATASGQPSTFERLTQSLFGRPSGSTGSAPSSGGNGAATAPASPAAPDPYFQTLADALAALFGGSQTAGRDAGLVAYPVSPTSSGGSGMSGKTIVFLIIAALVGWWAWKKYGKKAVSEAAA